MIIEQIYTGCLAQGAYYIESKGQVAIIDPLREVTPYIEKANTNSAKIKYIFETHFHADFVSGHVTLSEKTNAPIIYGPNANPSFNAIIASDEQIFKLGDITITALHTPGHTMESTTFLLKDSTGKDHAIFTGDTLFLGDVGRPDLAQKNGEITEKDLAGFLYDSLRTKIMPLADNVIVYPAHGAGSACGKHMMKQTVDTLGNQKKVNYALRKDMTKEEFISEVTHGLLAPPSYFPINVKLNKEGYQDVDIVLKKGSKPLSPEEFEIIANQQNALILDVRHHNDFIKGHIPKSIFIGLEGSFAPWVGTLISNIKQPILLVTPIGKEKETIIRLSRVGYDNTLGFLEGSFESWPKSGKEYDTVKSISAQEFKQEITTKKAPVFDVRKISEHLSEHLKNTINLPLDAINNHMNQFINTEEFYIHCAGGYRSIIAASILKSRGIHNFTDISGGFKAIKNADIKTSNFICPSTLK